MITTRRGSDNRCPRFGDGVPRSGVTDGIGRRAVRQGTEGDTGLALELRPNCEFCDKDLPPASMEARICTYECTFCANCADLKLLNVCPNCGGGFAPRPIRPAMEWRPGLSIAQQPASTKRHHLRYSSDNIKEHSALLSKVAPELR